jgi:glycogen synthase
MRILFLSNFYPPSGRGGYEQLCQEIADGLKAKGHIVAVLTSDEGFEDGIPKEENVFRLLKTEVDWRPYRGTLEFFVGQRKRRQESLLSFQETINTFKPDVLFVWGMWNLSRELLLLAESWTTLKVVYYLADYWPVLPDAYTLHWKEPARRWYTSLPKQVLGRVALALRGEESRKPLKFEHVLCVSQAVRTYLLEAGIPLQNARVVHNGIDLAPFTAAAKIRAQRGQKQDLALLYAGRLSPVKGVHTAIEATAELVRRGHSVTLDLYGTGSPEYQAKLLDLCRQLGVSERVQFRGFIPRDQMPEIMAQFDVLIFSSTWPEPLARIVQEAMAVGLVVVGTEVGGIPEILRNGVNGLTFAPENAEELATRVEQTVLDTELYHRLSEAGQATVEDKFDIRRTIAEVEAYLQSVIAGSHENSIPVPLVTLPTE